MSISLRTSPAPDGYIGSLSFCVMKNPIITSCGHHFDKAWFLTARKVNQSCPICRAENITFSVDKTKKALIDEARATHNWSPFQDPPLLSAKRPQPSRTRTQHYEPLYMPGPDMYYASFAVSYGTRQGVDFGGCCKDIMQYLFNCCCRCKCE